MSASLSAVLLVSTMFLASTNSQSTTSITNFIGQQSNATIEGTHSSVTTSHDFTTNHVTIDSDCKPNNSSYWHPITSAIRNYVAPGLIVFATIGNLFSVVVLQHPSFRHTSTSFILSVLALADLLAVYTGLLGTWVITRFNVNIEVATTQYGCQILILLTYFSRHISSWTIMLLTVERFVAVRFPLKIKQILSYRRIVITWCVMAVALFGLNSHFFVTHGFIIYQSSHKTYCNIVKRYENFNRQWVWIDAFVGDFFPFFFIFIVNVAIIATLLVEHNQRKKINRNLRIKLSSMTVTLFVVSVAFIVLNFPIDIYVIIIWNYSILEWGAFQQFYWFIIVGFSYLSNSINFILYFISGRKFRTAAFDIIRSVRDTACPTWKRRPVCNQRRQSCDPIIVDQSVYTTQTSASPDLVPVDNVRSSVI